MVGSQTTIVVGKNVAITCAGSAYGEAEECRFTQNHRVLEEEVAGTFIPAYGTGVFHGEVQIQELFSTDLDVLTMSTPGSNGDLPISTISFANTDTAGGSKTLTATARMNDVEVLFQKGKFVTARVRGVLNAPFS